MTHAHNKTWITAWGPIAKTYTMWHPVTGTRLRFPYITIRCNDIDCPALLGIRVSDFDGRLPQT